MIRSLFTAATGMIAQQMNLDVIANNLANVNTVGFKKSKADFQDLMYQIIEEPGTAANQQGTSPTGIQVGLGVRPAAVGKIHSQGDFESSGNPFDIAIEGDGFFQITLPNGDLAYTRAGAFKIDENGIMVSSDGFQLTPAVTIPADAIGVTVATDGTVSVRQPGSTAQAQVGQIQLARFQNPAGLRAVGRNLLEETEASGAATLGTAGENGLGTLAQGFLESSNVSVVEEIVSMVTGQRAYEANSKVIQTADQILTAAINVKR
ncbi:MAG: flagellar basal-body rod protein FlgG [Bdellovibrionales bacterium]|nr:flagellar basal-body rod protein FlgG [Bdellovibrionales bacterium]